MPYSTEQDPLLPKDEQAPEVMGSRPSSIKNFHDAIENEGKDEDDHNPKRHLLNDIMAGIFGSALLLSIFFILVPNGFWGKPSPMTIEQRVHQILVDTPLIGMPCPLLHVQILTLCRWP